MDPRDRDFQWKEISMGVTISEAVAPNVYPVWRWEVRDKGSIVDQRGFWRWLRPLVKMPTILDLLTAKITAENRHEEIKT